jgi:hypothetical protein
VCHKCSVDTTATRLGTLLCLLIFPLQSSHGLKEALRPLLALQTVAASASPCVCHKCSVDTTATRLGTWPVPECDGIQRETGEELISPGTLRLCSPVSRWIPSHSGTGQVPSRVAVVGQGGGTNVRSSVPVCVINVPLTPPLLDWGLGLSLNPVVTWTQGGPPAPTCTSNCGSKCKSFCDTPCLLGVGSAGSFQLLLATGSLQSSKHGVSQKDLHLLPLRRRSMCQERLHRS